MIASIDDDLRTLRALCVDVRQSGDDATSWAAPIGDREMFAIEALLADHARLAARVAELEAERDTLTMAHAMALRELADIAVICGEAGIGEYGETTVERVNQLRAALGNALEMEQERREQIATILARVSTSPFGYRDGAAVWVQESATRKGVWQTIYSSGRYSDHATRTEAEREAAAFVFAALDRAERLAAMGLLNRSAVDLAEWIDASHPDWELAWAKRKLAAVREITRAATPDDDKGEGP